MTDDERQAQIDFLIAANARYEARLTRDEQHIRELQDSFKLLVQLADNSDGRLDRADERTARLEEAFQTIADISARQDERIRSLEGKP